MPIRPLFAILLLVFSITSAIAQPWQRFAPALPSRSVVAADTVISGVPVSGTPASTEPALAVAQANAAALQDLINRYDRIEFTVPGRYYFAGRAIIDSNTDLVVGPGVELWRHSGYVNQPWIHTIGTSQTTNIVIRGGGLIGRVADAIAANDNTHTLILWHTRYVTIDNITFGDTSGPLYTNRDGKYAIYGNRSYDWNLNNLRFVGAITDGTTLHGPNAIGSDAIHATGACERWIITNVSGSTADNSIALMTRDYGAYETYNNGTTSVTLFMGDVKDIWIDGMNFWGSTELFRTTGRFEPIVRDSDLDSGGNVAGADVTSVVWTASTRQVSKTGLFNDYTWQEGDYLVIKGGTGVKRAGAGGEPDASDVSAAEPLIVNIVRKVSNDAVEVGIIPNSTDVANMTILNGAYTTHSVSNVVVRNITGSVSTNTHGIGLALDDTADATVKLTQCPTRNLVLENVRITVPSAGYALISVRGIQLESLELRGTIEHGPGSSAASPVIDHTGSRSVMRYFDARAATINKTTTGTATFSVINWEPSARLWHLGLLNIDNSLSSGGCTAINFTGDDGILTRIDDFDVGVLRHRCTNSGTNWGLSLYAGNGAQLRRARFGVLDFENITFGVTGALNSGPANTRSRIYADQIRAHGTLSSLTRGQVDLTYGSFVRDTASGELAYGYSNDTNSAPTFGPGNTLSFTVLSTDFTSAATSQTLTFSSMTRFAGLHLPRAASVTSVKVEILQAFDDGAGPITNATMDVGITATPTRYVNGFSAFALGGTNTTPAATDSRSLESESWPALACRLNTTLGNVNTLTTGAARITVTFE
jgi:hypothetical protein